MLKYSLILIGYLFRHDELVAEQKREEKVHTLKKNLKLLMIALIVLAIEKLSEFITALFSSQKSENPVNIIFREGLKKEGNQTRSRQGQAQKVEMYIDSGLSNGPKLRVSF